MPWILSEIPEEEKIKELLNQAKAKKLVEEAPFHPGYEDAAVGPNGRKFDGDKLRYDLIPPHAQIGRAHV